MIFLVVGGTRFQGRIHQCKDVIPIDPSTDLWFAEFTPKRANASHESLETKYPMLILEFMRYLKPKVYGLLSRIGLDHEISRYA